MRTLPKIVGFRRSWHKTPIRAIKLLVQSTLIGHSSKGLWVTQVIAGGELCVSCYIKPIREMKVKNLSGEKDFEFLNPYFSGYETIFLPSEKKIKIKKYFLNFKLWKGKPIPNTYGDKAVINWNSEPVFAEIAVLKLFQENNWNGVWVDSYRRKFRVGLPDIIEPVSLPQKQAKIIESIKNKIGASGGCWDIFVWNDKQFIFIELKRSKKDRIQDSQKRWLEVSLEIGFTLNNFALIEWDLD